MNAPQVICSACKKPYSSFAHDCGSLVRKTAYRYEDHVYSGVHIDPGGGEDYYTIGPKIELRTFDVVKETPKGFWIAEVGGFVGGKRQWIGKAHRKKYAHLTQKDALEGFLARKGRQIRILEKQLERAKIAFFKGKSMLETELVNNSL